jgi:hypothetical protein
MELQHQKKVVNHPKKIYRYLMEVDQLPHLLVQLLHHQVYQNYGIQLKVLLLIFLLQLYLLQLHHLLFLHHQEFDQNLQHQMELYLLLEQFQVYQMEQYPQEEQYQAYQMEEYL